MGESKNKPPKLLAERERKVKNVEDSKIIDLFNERSEQAIVELSKKYGSLCKKIAVSIVQNEPDAEECVSDAYLKIWNCVPPTVPDPLVTYVCQIVKTVSINRYKKNMAAKRQGVSELAICELEEVLSGHKDLEDDVEARRIAREINTFLDTVDADTRVMFVKRYYFGESVSEIAKFFHKSAHSVTQRLARSREKLKKYLLEKEILL